ncbi:cell wall-binding repeat-containing protein [Herbiconiux sp.]|uniref:cell wall-binding repeat-containing protein n=1 Tax=Herbiconiux sp. TaxID=1871186 RepID=UPI0025C5B796|nr:cell wall-binding repeat-containing protein [Herbiconiux sp.]
MSMVLLTGVLGAVPASAGVPASGTTEIVSVDAAGMPGAGSSTESSVSSDGRFVAFTSTSALTGATTGAASQVFVKDMTTGAVRLVSAGSDTGSPAAADASLPSISGDGRYVAFVSAATNLEAFHNNAGVKQVFVRDLAPGGLTRLVSVSASGTAGGDAESGWPSMAADGRSVAFQSRATNLIAGSAPAGAQVYQADLTTAGLPRLAFVSLQDVSRSSMPALANAAAAGPSSSADGSIVAFVSSATNLTADIVAAGVSQIFVHNTRTGATTLVSAAAGKAEGGDRGSFEPAVSGDGSRIAYISLAANLTGTPAGTSPTVAQVFLRTLNPGGSSELVSLDRAGTAPADRTTSAPSISDDGRQIAFVSDATNQTTATIPGASRQVVVRDMTGKKNTTVSVVASSPNLAGAAPALYPAVSGDGRFVSFATSSAMITATETSGRSAVYVRGIGTMQSVIERIGGTDRYAVSATVSRTSFSPGVSVAYVASGVVFPDALSGSAAAGRSGGPVLLVRRDGIPTDIETELKRLTPDRIVVLGGTATVSPSVEQALAEFVSAPSKVTRMDGADRYAVSATVSSRRFPPEVPVAYVASGAVFPDALSGSAAAGLGKGPVLLVSRTGLSENVRLELGRLKPKSIVILGGTSSVPESVMADLTKIQPAISRIAGDDRYEVSAEVARVAFTQTGGTVYVASGRVFPDALSGSAAAIGALAPVLLVSGDRIPGDVATQLTRLKPTRIVVLGGTATVTEAVYEELRGYLAR